MTDLEFFELLLDELKLNRIMNYPNEEGDYKLKLNELQQLVNEFKSRNF
ncbi:MAG: hypothetical protein J6D33_03475 [Turicibacter sp.]|nr:hypothetical protein [Turicibacter sp.]